MDGYGLPSGLPQTRLNTWSGSRPGSLKSVSYRDEFMGGRTGHRAGAPLGDSEMGHWEKEPLALSEILLPPVDMGSGWQCHFTNIESDILKG